MGQSEKISQQSLSAHHEPVMVPGVGWGAVIISSLLSRLHEHLRTYQGGAGNQGQASPREGGEHRTCARLAYHLCMSGKLCARDDGAAWRCEQYLLPCPPAGSVPVGKQSPTNCE